MSAGVSEQRADVIHVPVAEEDVSRGNGVVDGRGRADVEDHSLARAGRFRRRRIGRIPPRGRGGRRRRRWRTFELEDDARADARLRPCGNRPPVF